MSRDRPAVQGPGMDRRAVLGWAAVVAGAVGAGFGWRAYTGASAPAASAPATAAAPGYGKDPPLVEPAAAPWPRTLDSAQRSALAERLERLLPASAGLPGAVELGLVDFFDEWLSAPYPDQQADRALLLPLLERGGVADAAAETRLRVLALAATYTTPAGIAAIGFVGNEARAEFEPLPPAVVERLEAAFARLPERQA